MSLVEIITSERERYVQFYAAAKRKHASENGDVAGELLISINNERMPYPYRYFRVDLISRGSTESPVMSEVVLQPNLELEAKGFAFGPFQVEVYPFAWCRVQIGFDRPPAKIRQIEGFLTRWLDVDDQNAVGQEGLSGAIHSATEIETDGSWWFLTVDLGTAPPDVMFQFIELLAGQGMTRIILKAG